MKLTVRPPRQSRWPVLLLAGGQGRRLGGCDKGGLPSPAGRDRSLLADAIERFSVLGPVWVASGLTYRADLPADQLQLLDPPFEDAPSPTDRAGPLAGLCAGMTHALAHFDSSILLSCPVDLVGLRSELLRQLAEGIEADPRLQVLLAQRDQQPEPLVAAWRVDSALLHDCRLALGRGERAVHRWQQTLRKACLAVPVDEPEWINVNTPEDWARVLGGGSQSR